MSLFTGSILFLLIPAFVGAAMIALNKIGDE